MRRLDRYIASSVVMAILAVLGIVVGLALLFAFIDELGDVEGRYGVLDAVVYVLLTTPTRIYEMLPMAALIGCLIGLGSLASSSELTIMRAAGVSLRRIVWSVMKPMLVVMLAGLLIGEYVAPWTENRAQANRSMAQGGGEAQSSKRGVWHLQGREFVHINSVQPGGLLYGVTRYVFDEERRMLEASFAKRARYQEDRWELEEVSSTHFEARSTRSESRESQPWVVELTPELLGTVVLDPDALSISGLWRYTGYLSEQGLDSSRYWLAFWNKLMQPLVTAALVLLAISFIFGPLRSVTLGQRVFTGVLIGFTFRIGQDLLGPSSLVFGFSPLLAVTVPALLCLVIGLLLLRRAG